MAMWIIVTCKRICVSDMSVPTIDIGVRKCVCDTRELVSKRDKKTNGNDTNINLRAKKKKQQPKEKNAHSSIGPSASAPSVVASK